MSYVKELRSRELSVDPGLRIEREFLVRGPTDEIDAEAVLLGAIPQAIAVPGRDFSLELGSYKVREKGPRWFEATTTYVEPADPTGGAEEKETLRLSFNISTETEHITQSLKTVNWCVRDGATRLNTMGVIGQTPDLEAQDCDILTAKLSIDYTTYYPQRYVTFDWVRSLSRVVAHPNDAKYKGFNVGELMLVGVSGAYRQLLKDWEISYSFLTSPTVRDLVIDGLGTVTEKIGFDYLWIRYEKFMHPSNKLTLQRPLQANVERVYTFVDYRVLGI